MEGHSTVVYYATNTRRATLGELLRMSPPGIPGKLTAILVKVLQLQIQPQMGMALYDARLVPFSEIPELYEYFSKQIDSLEGLGFHQAAALRMPMVGGGSCCSLAFLGRDSLVYANIVYSRALADGRAYGESGVSFVSRGDSAVWATTSMNRLLDSPACIRIIYCPGCSVERLLETHINHISAVTPRDLKHLSAGDLCSALLEVETMVADFNIARGVFRPLTDAEVANLS